MIVTAADLRSISEAKLNDALLLLQNARWSNAYYLAGYAVEVAIKVLIARRFRADEIPDKGFLNKVYTHNLATLVTLAELDDRLENEMQNPDFAANWAVVANWSGESRYLLINQGDARSMCNAVGDPQSGVFPWLTRFW